PFDTNPVFSVDYDRYRVVSGSSMHGLIRLWDMRYYKSPDDYSGTLKKGAVRDGWSIFLGKSQNSPVYSLQMSHSRLVAALANQTWMLDFGCGGLSSPDSPHPNFHRSRHRLSGERRGINAPLYYLHQEWNKIYEAWS
ncbi:11289_t:CDS:2, partial [Ambispora leptoticha]